MNAGHFNRRIRIERQDGQLDAWGQPLDAWQPAAELWAAIIADRAASVQRLTLASRRRGATRRPPSTAGRADGVRRRTRASRLPATIRRQRFHVRLAAARQA